MSESVTVPSMAEERKRHPGLGLKGLWQVFVSPTELFSKVKEDPKVLVPYIVLFLAGLVFMVFLTPYIIDAQMQSPQMQNYLDQGVTREQLEMSMKFTVPVFGALMLMLGPLLIGGLAAFWGGFVFAGRSPFKAVLSVTLFGEVLYFLGSYTLLPMVLIKKSMLVSYSLAALIPNPSLESFWYVLLSKISVFHIWELIVLGIGYSIIFGISRNKGLWVSVLSMGLLSLLHAVSAVIGSMFS